MNVHEAVEDFKNSEETSKLVRLDRYYELKLEKRDDGYLNLTWINNPQQ